MNNEYIKSELQIAQDYLQGYNAACYGFPLYSEDPDFRRGHSDRRNGITAEVEISVAMLKNRERELSAIR